MSASGLPAFGKALNGGMAASCGGMPNPEATFVAALRRTKLPAGSAPMLPPPRSAMSGTGPPLMITGCRVCGLMITEGTVVRNGSARTLSGMLPTTMPAFGAPMVN